MDLSSQPWFPFSFLNVTERAAQAAYQWLGRGDKHAADAAAVQAMREELNVLSIKGRVVIGEGEMDKAPMLYIGEEVGRGGDGSLEIDLALDPLDGTKATAKGMPRALCVLAGSQAGGLLHAPDMYMSKIVVRAGVDSSAIDLDADLEENVRVIARSLNKPLEDVGVCLLDRPRHEAWIKRLYKMGVKVYLITDGDVAGALYTLLPQSGIDMYIGIGGAPEGVITAAAVVCMGGFMQARLVPHSPEEEKRVQAMGLSDASKKLSLQDLARSPLFFLATGVSDDLLLKGIQQDGQSRMSHTLLLSCSHKGQMFYVRRHCSWH